MLGSSPCCHKGSDTTEHTHAHMTIIDFILIFSFLLLSHLYLMILREPIYIYNFSTLICFGVFVILEKTGFHILADN